MAARWMLTASFKGMGGSVRGGAGLVRAAGARCGVAPRRVAACRRAALSSEAGAGSGGAGGAGAEAAGSSGQRGFFFPILAGATSGALMYHNFVGDIREHPAYWFASGLGAVVLKQLDGETAHVSAVKAMAAGLGPKEVAGTSPESLRTTVWGLEFPSAVGLAAGFDKHAEAPEALLKAGFGFVEVGTVTPKPQEGNPKPRVFRLKEDNAVINRYGFNSEGLDAAFGRIEVFRKFHAAQVELTDETRAASIGVLGINIGKNKEGVADFDFALGAAKMAPLADYLVINVSSPNTPGLRALQRIEPLRKLIQIVQLAAQNSSVNANRPCPPIVVKIAPDMTNDQLKDVATVVKELKVDGVIVSNTTIARPVYLRSENKGEAGGLSGAPVRSSSTEVLRRMYALLDGKVPIIGVGGVSCGQDAYDKIRAGASLVQVYTALSYSGLDLVPQIKKELAQCLKSDGFESVADAVGADHRE